MKHLPHGLELVGVVLKLTELCVKVDKNRKKLLDPKLGTMPTMLGLLRLIVSSSDKEIQGYNKQLLKIISSLLLEAIVLDAGYFQVC